jgi:hypothetical protein
VGKLVRLGAADPENFACPLDIRHRAQRADLGEAPNWALGPPLRTSERPLQHAILPSSN